MRNQRDTRLLDSIIATSFERRHKDDIRIGCQHHLRIEVALHANLHDTSILYSLLDILVKEVLRSRQSLDHIVSIENGEV